MEFEWDVHIAYVALFLMSLFPIYYGSYRSLSSKKTEKITSSQAMTYPIIMSVFLFGLYLLLKFFREDLVNSLLSIYFLLIGVYAISNTILPLINFLLPFTKNELFELDLSFTCRLGNVVSLGYLYRTKEEQTWVFKITLGDIFGGIIGIAISVWYVYTKNWTLTNFIGECYSIMFIELCSLGSFKNGFMLLGGLFLYDVFWVYGTDVMVSVAKKIDAPIKLLWPKQGSYGMLGLGDIVIPGIFIAMMWRFDAHLAQLEREKVEGNKDAVNEGSFFKVSFIWYMISFIFGLVVLVFFESAQPMMFYFVPALLISVLVHAIRLNKLKELVFYNEEEEEGEKEKEKEGEEEDDGEDEYEYVEGDGEESDEEKKEK